MDERRGPAEAADTPSAGAAAPGGTARDETDESGETDGDAAADGERDPSRVRGDGGSGAPAPVAAGHPETQVGVRRPSGALAGARRRLARWFDGSRRHWPTVRLVVFALAGASVAVALFGRVPAKVGPFETTVSARPSIDGHTVVHVAPLGTIDLDTHDAPMLIDLRLDGISVADAERIAANPGAIDRLGDDAADEVRAALVDLAVRCLLAALVGGALGGLAARVDWRTALAGLGVGALLVAVLGAGAALSFRPGAVSEPRYTGLLTRAPAAVGDIESVLDRFGEYREQLSDLVDNMATLYLAGSELPTFQPDSELIRVLHVSDIHLNPQAFDMIERLTEQFGVDAVADTGDITDWGTDPETRVLDRIGDLDVPYVYVRGNHDSRRTQAAVAEQPNAVVLDGDAETVAGLRFWGIGDPRYTPDKNEESGGLTEQERAVAFAPEVADRLSEDEPPPVDVVMVHDERTAGDLGGVVPLVLAGHTHEQAESRIDPLGADDDGEGSGDDATDGSDGDEPGDGTTTTDQAGDEAGGDGDDEAGTLLLVEGSTGGAGLRGLQGDEPKPLSASVLYFDPDTGRLVAYDRITVAWLEDAGATIERHIVDPAGEDPPA